MAMRICTHDGTLHMTLSWRVVRLHYPSVAVIIDASGSVSIDNKSCAHTMYIYMYTLVDFITYIDVCLLGIDKC